MSVAFANVKATHIFFSKNISVYAIFNDQSFNDMLTNSTVSFEQMGPDIFFSYFSTKTYIVGTHIQSNFNGSNIFGTMEIYSRDG